MVAVEAHFLQSSLQDEENLYVFFFFFGRQINRGRSQQSFLNYRSFWGRQSQSDFLDKFSRSLHFWVFFFPVIECHHLCFHRMRNPTRTNFILAIFPSVKFFGQAFSFFYCFIRLNFRLNERKGTKQTNKQ